MALTPNISKRKRFTIDKRTIIWGDDNTNSLGQPTGTFVEAQFNPWLITLEARL